MCSNDYLIIITTPVKYYSFSYFSKTACGRSTNFSLQQDLVCLLFLGNLLCFVRFTNVKFIRFLESLKYDYEKYDITCIFCLIWTYCRPYHVNKLKLAYFREDNINDVCDVFKTIRNNICVKFHTKKTYFNFNRLQ